MICKALLCINNWQYTVCDHDLFVDVQASTYSDTLACLMITYPSTHGVFDEGIRYEFMC